MNTRIRLLRLLVLSTAAVQLSSQCAHQRQARHVQQTAQAVAQKKQPTKHDAELIEKAGSFDFDCVPESEREYYGSASHADPYCRFQYYWLDPFVETMADADMPGYTDKDYEKIFNQAAPNPKMMNLGHKCQYVKMTDTSDGRLVDVPMVAIGAYCHTQCTLRPECVPDGERKVNPDHLYAMDCMYDTPNCNAKVRCSCQFQKGPHEAPYHSCNVPEDANSLMFKELAKRYLKRCLKCTLRPQKDPSYVPEEKYCGPNDGHISHDDLATVAENLKKECAEEKNHNVTCGESYRKAMRDEEKREESPTAEGKFDPESEAYKPSFPATRLGTRYTNKVDEAAAKNETLFSVPEFCRATCQCALKPTASHLEKAGVTSGSLDHTVYVENCDRCQGDCQEFEIKQACEATRAFDGKCCGLAKAYADQCRKCPCKYQEESFCPEAEAPICEA